MPRHAKIPWSAEGRELAAAQGRVFSIRPPVPRITGITHTVEWRSQIQEEAGAAMLVPGDKILALSPGTGKTLVALRSAVDGSRFPVLIVVHTQALLHQWVQRINDFIPGVEVGHIQQDVARWEGYPIAVAMLHTLIKRKFPPAFYRYWRLMVADEVHNLGAATFSVACSLLDVERWGLSATLARRDGMDRVIRMHMGEVAYEDLSQPLKPDTYFVMTGISVDERRYRGRMGRTNLAKLTTDLAAHEGRNALIMHWINKSLASGRTILVLGERLAQLTELCDACTATDSKAVYIGSMGQDERREALNKKVVFATQHLAKEGLDRPEFDTLFVLFPFGGYGRLQQSWGRILRLLPGKKKPKAFVFTDSIQVMEALSSKMQRHLMDMDFKYKAIRE